MGRGGGGRHEPLLVPRADDLGDCSSNLGRSGQTAGRVRPHACEIEAIEPGNRLGYEGMPSLEFLAGLPGHVGSLPVPGVPLEGEQRGQVNHLDLVADAIAFV